jgi:hypothetical protein
LKIILSSLLLYLNLSPFLARGWSGRANRRGDEHRTADRIVPDQSRKAMKLAPRTPYLRATFSLLVPANESK